MEDLLLYLRQQYHLIAFENQECSSQFSEGKPELFLTSTVHNEMDITQNLQVGEWFAGQTKREISDFQPLK